jgi:hypothetical protein
MMNKHEIKSSTRESEAMKRFGKHELLRLLQEKQGI